MAKSIPLTILLAILIPGLGHMYAGFLKRGIIILVGWIAACIGVNFATGFVVGFIKGFLQVSEEQAMLLVGQNIGFIALAILPYYGWEIYDAWKHVKAMNSRVASVNRAPE